MERRVLEEQEADKRKQLYAVELQLQIQQATSKQKILEEEALERKKQEEAELQKSFEAAAAALERSKEEKAAERRKFEETLEAKIEEAKESVRLELEAQALSEASAVAERLRTLELALQKQKETSDSDSEPNPITVQKRRVSRAMSGQHRAADIPLGVLLKNYVLVLLRDQRNFIIVLLSAVVVYMSVNMDPASRTQLFPLQMIGLPDDSNLVDPVSTIAVTTTATSFSTFTITEVVTATSMAETPLPVPQEVGPVIEVVQSLPQDGLLEEPNAVPLNIVEEKPIVEVEAVLPYDAATESSTGSLSYEPELIAEGDTSLPQDAITVADTGAETPLSPPQESAFPATFKDTPVLPEEQATTPAAIFPLSLPICAKDAM